jgi:iron(III) transport system ATP-binding protein
MIAEQPPLLELSAISFQFPNQRPLFENFSLRLNKGQIACLLGPSGCGKTTVLRCISGFEKINAGEILLKEKSVSSAQTTLPPEQRNIGMVFQDYALFPHLTVEKNIAFGLRKFSETEKQSRVNELLDVISLKKFAAKYPHELSGGQQQRVALARALAPKPDVLLLDEPFSNLDVELRQRLSLEVRDILKQMQTTAILVTHDQNEAFALADEIGVMNNGRIEQWDSAYNLYHRPATRFVADFIGEGVLLNGKMKNDNQVEMELGTFSLDTGHTIATGTDVEVLLRPDDVLHDDDSPLQAEVLDKNFRGAEILYTLRFPGGGKAFSLVPSHHNHSLGSSIGIRLEIDHVIAFPRDQRPIFINK